MGMYVFEAGFVTVLDPNHHFCREAHRGGGRAARDGAAGQHGHAQPGGGGRAGGQAGAARGQLLLPGRSVRKASTLTNHAIYPQLPFFIPTHWLLLLICGSRHTHTHTHKPTRQKTLQHPPHTRADAEPEHLRGGRLHRVPGAGIHLHGAGPARVVPHVGGHARHPGAAQCPSRIKGNASIRHHGLTGCLAVCPTKQGEDHGEVVKSVMHNGFLGRDTEQLFPYGIYTYVAVRGWK